MMDPENTAYALLSHIKSCFQLKGFLYAKEQRMINDTTLLRRLVQDIFMYKLVLGSLTCICNMIFTTASGFACQQMCKISIQGYQQ